MGTSSSHRGNKDKKELLPNDYVKPIVSWQATKTEFSKYINGIVRSNQIYSIT